MPRKKYPEYVPVTIEARQPNGDWAVRNRLIHANAKVIAGEETRAWLIDLARRMMTEWYISAPDRSMDLRVSGVKQAYDAKHYPL